VAEPETNPNALITVARAQQSPQLASLTESVLTTLIASASVAIQNYCNRNFVLPAEDYEEAYDGDGDCELLLRKFPISSITAVTIIEEDGTEVAINPTEFRIKAETGLIRFKPDSTATYTYFPHGFQNVRVEYKAGFEDVPEDVQQACVLLVCRLRQREKRDEEVVSESLGDYQASYSKQAVAGDAGPAGLPDSVRTLLARYRDIQIGMGT